MKKILIFQLLFSIIIFSDEIFNNIYIIKKIEKVDITCKKENLKKIKNEKFIGNINEVGELFGEFYFLDSPNIKYCISNEEIKIFDEENKKLYYYNEKFNETIFKFYNENLYQYSSNGSYYYLEKENGRYKRIYNKLLVPNFNLGRTRKIENKKNLLDEIFDKDIKKPYFKNYWSIFD